MQNFIDATTQKLWSFDSDVIAAEENGQYTFTDARGEALVVPATLQPYVPSAEQAADAEAAAARAALALQASNLLAAGFSVISTGTPEINGTYATDPLSQSDIIAIETSLNAGKGFPGGATTFEYPDAGGEMHTFAPANFTDFAAAVRDFVYGCRAVIAGKSTTLPTSTTTIA
ncbi:hypothetical protein BZM27_39625 [Paraburkholderia steynii]|uniref:DUF4376 domain-containing protein n=1 Tax=Paraburkholderia steynii TaxID=1245441 RepID=A0A4R0X6Z6_9BURK|nr:hypothetical protein BZM27_39625 [Paraburkholderia steynii]